MVWATSRDWAVQRVRRSAWDRTLTPEQVRARSTVLHAPVRCRLARDNDVRDWLVAGGSVQAVEGWFGLDRVMARLAYRGVRRLEA
jgi:hypothetical protein